jgi:hypothetical protein
MQALIESYGLESSIFLQLLESNNAIISGSSVLSVYLDNMFVPNDIDIWINLDKKCTEHLFQTYKEIYDEISINFFNFLWKSGFEEKELIKSSPEINTEDIKIKNNNNYQNISVGGNKIYKVIEFVSEDSYKKIQLVFIKNIDPIIFINKYFDLSVCKTWYNPKTNNIETSDIENTSNKLMYTSYDCSYEDLHRKNKDRIEKYKNRGFKLIENPT